MGSYHLDDLAMQNQRGRESMSMPSEPDHDLVRVHERLDDLFGSMGKLETAVARIAEGCPPCKALAQKHEEAIYGNGKAGILTRLTATESGRVDTLSIKAVVTLISAVGTLAGAIAGAIGGTMAILVK